MTKKCKKLGLGRKAQMWKAGENTNNLSVRRRKMGKKTEKSLKDIIQDNFPEINEGLNLWVEDT